MLIKFFFVKKQKKNERPFKVDCNLLYDKWFIIRSSIVKITMTQLSHIYDYTRTVVHVNLQAVPGTVLNGVLNNQHIFIKRFWSINDCWLCEELLSLAAYIRGVIKDLAVCIEYFTLTIHLCTCLSTFVSSHCVCVLLYTPFFISFQFKDTGIVII